LGWLEGLDLGVDVGIEEDAVWEGLLAFPTVVGLADGVRISIPNPKNTDSRTTKILARIIT
jgi:hypothetical protein